MRVITNTAVSVDGKIGVAGPGSVPVGSRTDLRYMSVLRARADAILVGGATFRNWPRPSLPDARAIATLRAEGFPGTDHPPLEGRRWWNVVVTRGLEVPRTGPFYEEPRTRPLFLTSSRAPVGNAEVEVADDVTVPWILERLEARGVRELLVEAGGDLIYQFLAADAVDELYVTVCPVIFGGRDAPSLAGGAGFTGETARRLRLLDVHRAGDELFCHYAVTRASRG